MDDLDRVSVEGLCSAHFLGWGWGSHMGVSLGIFRTLHCWHRSYIAREFARTRDTGVLGFYN